MSGLAPPKLVLAVIDGLKPAMLERAVAHRPRAGARGGHGARRRTSTSCVRGVPVRHARVRGVDRHRRRARTATASRR